MKKIAEVMSVAGWEYLVISIALLMLAVGIIYSGAYARRENRDGQVREDLRKLKTSLEMYYNKYATYPLQWDTGQYEYVVTSSEAGAAGWYVSGLLENAPDPTAGFDEEYNIDWRVTNEGNYEICGGTARCREGE